jgi:hypothetical protein
MASGMVWDTEDRDPSKPSGESGNPKLVPAYIPG